MESSNQNEEKWKCPLCHKSLKSPVVTHCGHIYCWPCICEWLKESSACPKCNKFIQKDDLVPIYGQTGEANEHSVPPPPKAHRVDPPPEEPRPAFNRGGDFQINFGVFPFGFGFTTQIGGNNGGMSLFMAILPMILMYLLFAFAR